MARGQPPQPDGQGARHQAGAHRDPHADRRRASTSTSPCCSRSRSMPRSPKPTSPGSKPSPRRAATRTRWRASRASLSAASTRWSTTSSTRKSPQRQIRPRRRGCKRSRAKSRSPTPSSPTSATRRSIAGSAGSASRSKGAQTQRLLWASTGTKNKAYSDVLYVDELIGRGHGQHDAAGDDGCLSATTASRAPSLEEDVDAAQAVMDALPSRRHFDRCGDGKARRRRRAAVRRCRRPALRRGAEEAPHACSAASSIR